MVLDLRQIRAAVKHRRMVPVMCGRLAASEQRGKQMSEPHGFDVSYAQGAHFPWASERGRISFGMCKATEGLHTTDPDLEANWNGMWELSSTLPRFAYHFFHAAEDPVAQARRFVAAVKPHGLLAGDNLVLDLEATESNGTNDGESPGAVSERARQFLNTVNGLAPGHRVLVYTSPSFAETGACAGLGSWFLWIANYGVSRPSVPLPWRIWSFWQTGDSPVDSDVFNGNEATLLNFCRMPKSR
jgi:lysozyme